MQPSPTVPPQEYEPAELAVFREAWKAEVQKKKQQTQPIASTSKRTEDSTGPKDISDDNAQFVANAQELAETSASSVSISAKQRPLPSFDAAARPAVDIYRRAVLHEQRGELDDALVLYRKAFRMDAQVDRVYQAEESKLETLLSVAERRMRAVSISASTSDTVAIPNNAEATSLQPNSSVAKAKDGRESIATVLAGFPESLTFQPEDETVPTPLNTVPDEVIVLIIRKMDPSTIEQFATVCRKARVVTLDSSIWRELVESTYKPPQIPDAWSLQPVVKRYLSDYRRVFIEHPRVRLDGVYISVCRYVRHGLSENHWVNISHLVTYHRYLRFFPNGQVLSLLVNDELSPQQIIPILKPTLRMKGLFVGTWYLDGRTICLTDLFDASGRFAVPPMPPRSHTLVGHASSHSASTHPPAPIVAPRYIFRMTLSLDSRPHFGRWNKLSIKTYDSVNVETGDVSNVKSEKEKREWFNFSKVRSWGMGVY